MTVVVNRPPKFADLPGIPGYIPPLDTGQTNANDLNDLGAKKRATFAAGNSIIPIVHGRDRLFGQVATATICPDTGCLLVAFTFCEGEIQGYEQFFISGKDIIADGTGYFGLKNRGFESGAYDHWQTAGTAISNVESRSGDWAGKVASAAGGPNLLSDHTVAPAEGTVMRLRGYMMRDELALPDAAATVAVRWYDAAFAAVGGRDGGTTPTGFTNLADHNVSGWQECVADVTVPATAVYYRFDFGEAPGTTGEFYCDDASTVLVKADGEEFGIELVHYTGTQTQITDSMLESVLTGYVDTNPGTAYVVGRFPPKSTSGFPRLEAILQGKKVFDPRKYNTLYDDLGDPQFVLAANTDADSAQWFINSYPTQATTIASDSWTVETASPSPAAATYVERTDNNDNTQQIFSKYVPVDETKDYTVTVYVQQPIGDRRNYLLVDFIDANDLRINNTSSPVSDATGWGSVGSYHYHSLVNVAGPGSWTKYQFDFGPSAGADGTIPTGAVTMAIGGILLRDGPVGTNSTIRLSDYRVFEGLKETEQLESDITTYEYSTNPAVAFHDVITNNTGMGILDQGVADLANYNDELISGVKRREIGLTMAKPSQVDSWIGGFRTYMGGFIGWEDGKIRVIPNKPDVEAPGAALFDGSVGTYVDVGDQAELSFGTGDFSLEVAFRGSANAFIAGKFDGATGYTCYLNGGGFFQFLLDDGTNSALFTSATPLWDSVWHTASVSIDRTADEMTVVLDGVAQTPVDISAVTLTVDNTTPFRIGSSNTGATRWVGEIDEVRVWNDERTIAEMQDNRFNEIENPLADASLVGYWRMNEDASAGTARDSSVSANDGTAAGAATFTNGYAQIIPVGVAMHIGVDDIVKDSLKVNRRTLRSVPNSVAVDYEDSSGLRWVTSRAQSDSSRVTSELEARRLSRVSLPGIHNASQAQREATQRLNWYLTDLEATVSLFDPGWTLQNGSIVAVTHPIGLDAKLMRVRGLNAKSGRWVLDLVEYDPAVYSDEVISDPTIPDTNLGDPLNPPAVTNLTLVEELFRYRNGIWGSRVRATFDATTFPFLSQYLVEGYVDGVKVWESTSQSNNVVTPGVEEIVDDAGAPIDYEVRVYTQSPFATSPAASDTIEIEGKFAIPSDVPGITATQTGAGQVVVSWEDAIDIDIWRYLLKIGTTSDTWETATKTDLMDDTDRVFVGLALGTHRWFVKAIDSVRQESATAAFTDLTLIAPPAVATLNGFEVASEVRLNWPAPTTGFVARYRIAYSDIPETFETTLDVVDTLRFQTKDVPEGTFTFKVYAQDDLGNESATAAERVIEVTSDADAFLADSYTFNNPTLTNMVEWFVRLDDRQFYVTNMGDTFAVSPTDFVTSVPLANYHSTGASEWLSEVKDFGLLLTGSWNLTHDVTALSGVYDIALELSTDDVTYTVFGASAKGDYRYARVRVSTAASPGTATAFVKSPIMDLKINVVPLEESGEATSSATVGKTINLTREYTALKEVNAQPKNNTDALMAIVDNIVVGPNTGIKGDGTNYLNATDPAAYDFGATQDFTVEFMAKHSGGAATVDGLIWKRDTAAGNIGWEIYVNENSKELVVVIDEGTNSVSCLTTGDAFPDDGAWHHYAVTVDRTADEVRIYKDTVLNAASPHSISTITLTLANGGNLEMFARNGGVNRFSGSLDEVRIWNDVRTPAEIVANYDTELDLTQTQAGLIGYWRMNGSVSTVVGATVSDASTSGVNLTNTGAGDLTYVDPGKGNGNDIQKINSFDVYVFDIFGQQLLEEFQWNWKAV